LVGKAAGNSCPWTNGLTQNMTIAATVVAHKLRVSWRTAIPRTSTASENRLTFLGILPRFCEIAAHVYVGRAIALPFRP
jgi:hypothetical protein